MVNYTSSFADGATVDSLLTKVANPLLLKLDDFGSPDDNTNLNVSTDKHGLCPKGANTGTKYLCDDATWAVVNIDGGSP